MPHTLLAKNSHWAHLDSAVESAHLRNIETHCYTLEECQSVRERSTQLVPTGFELGARDSELLRALAVFSNTELRPPAQITSHRRFIGPIIVFIKKLSWPLVQLHLKETVIGIREFHSLTLTVIARQLVEIEELKKRQ
jgi:hypothetical protein